jgi:flagellar hook-basal body complex protein FliE
MSNENATQTFKAAVKSLNATIDKAVPQANNMTLKACDVTHDLLGSMESGCNMIREVVAERGGRE